MPPAKGLQLVIELVQGIRIITGDATAPDLGGLLLVVIGLVHRGEGLAEGVVDAVAVAPVPALGVMPHQDGLAKGDGGGHLVGLVVEPVRFVTQPAGLFFVTRPAGFLLFFVAVHDGVLLVEVVLPRRVAPPGQEGYGLTPFKEGIEHLAVDNVQQDEGIRDVPHFHAGPEFVHQGDDGGRGPVHVTGAEAVAHLRSRRFGQAMRGNAGQDLAGVVDDSVAAHSQAPLR